jgi:hypothetical protein
MEVKINDPEDKKRFSVESVHIASNVFRFNSYSVSTNSYLGIFTSLSPWKANCYRSGSANRNFQNINNLLVYNFFIFGRLYYNLQK